MLARCRAAVAACVVAVLCAASPTVAHAALPSPSNRLVNDYAGVLNKREAQRLEQRLVAFDDSTSNQILVIITPSLDGYEIMDYAQKIGDAWGVGQSDLKNGVVIVVKVRNETSGEVAIAPGYGLEGALPDVACRHIIDEVMIPRLAENEYYDGIVEALDVIEPLARGEYSFQDYQRRERREILIGTLVCAVLFIAVAIFLILYKNKKHPPKGDNLVWDDDDDAPMHGSRRRWWGTGAAGMGGMPWGGGFGGGSFGGGGFGGFGGGSFGGGGAHGKF